MQNNENAIKQEALREEQLEAVTGAQSIADQMVYRIGEYCSRCGDCLSHCWMNCITPGEKRYFIDAELCVGCGDCASYCPTGCIEKVYH